MPPDDFKAPGASLLFNLEQEWQALEHFQTACGLLADGEYAAAKLELELSLALKPAKSFYHYKRMETLGDIESSLGDDVAALGHYRRALELALGWQESWTHTELRLKLVWALLRQSQIDEAYRVVKTALAVCEQGANEPAGARRGLNYLTALALATLADVHFHQHNIDAAIATARQAAAVTGRLGQAYAQKVRLLTYLAWQLYRHDETSEARALAERAQAALGRWMPLDARYVRSIRTTLSTILGTPSSRKAPPPRTSLPAPEARIGLALSAARAMQDWLRQLLTLHALAPYLAPGQVTPPHTDIQIWSEDCSHEKKYRILLAADLARALAKPKNTPSTAARRLIALEPHAFHFLSHEWLHAETLLRMRDMLGTTEQALVEHSVTRCASAWCDEIRRRPTDGATIALFSGLAVLLPHLPPDARQSACQAIEAALLSQLQPRNSMYSDAFLVGLPALARCGAGHEVANAMLERERLSVDLWIACLAHTDDSDSDGREAMIETVLGMLQTRLTYGSSTDVAEMLCWLAPYLGEEQARQALALATSVRSIVPRVRALAALARALPADEGMVIYETAWKAAQRSTNADVRGEALATLVVSMAASRFRGDAAGGTNGDALSLR